MQNEFPEKYNSLKQLIKTNHFVRYVLTNIDTSLASTDERIMKMYAHLVEDEKTRETILNLLLNELAKTRKLMQELLGRPMEERRKNHFYSTALRAEALDILHSYQLKKMKKWRNKELHSTEEKENLLHQLLISVNAIANAMGTTG
jgi:phosphoenolpyruvate carboxylase